MGVDAGTNCAALVRAKDKSAIPRASVLSDTNGRKFPYMILPQIGMLVERGDGEGCATRKCELLFPGGLVFLILLLLDLRRPNEPSVAVRAKPGTLPWRRYRRR